MRSYPTTSWNAGLTKSTDARVLSGTVKSIAGKQGRISGCAAWTTEQRSNAAKAQGFGGYRANSGRSKKFQVIDSFGTSVVLQSSYELKCAQILDELQIKWVRPKSLWYSNRRYYADFFLPEFDIYLDPKNDYKATLDANKIQQVVDQNNVTVVILLHSMITKEFIASLLQFPLTLSDEETLDKRSQCGSTPQAGTIA